MNKYLKISFFVIGVAVFIYLLQNFGFEKIFYHLENSGALVIYVVLVWFAAYLLNGYSYYKVVNEDEKKISYFKLFSINLISFALNYVTPFLNLGGEAYRILMVKEELGTTKALSTTVLYNMIHILSHLFFWLIGTLCLFIIYPKNNTIIVFGSIAIIILSFAIIFLMSRHKNGLINSILRPLLNVKFIERYFRRHPNKKESLLKLDSEIIELYTLRKSSFYKALIAEFMSRVVVSLEFFFILNSLNINIGFLQVIYIHALSSLVLNLTFFIPMELGTREASLYLIMGSLVDNPSIGIFVAVINRIREFVWIFIGLVLMHFLKTSKVKYLETQKII